MLILIVPGRLDAWTTGLAETSSRRVVAIYASIYSIYLMELCVIMRLYIYFSILILIYYTQWVQNQEKCDYGFFSTQEVKAPKIVLNIIISNTDFVRTSGQNAKSSPYVLYGDAIFPIQKSQSLWVIIMAFWRLIIYLYNLTY